MAANALKRLLGNFSELPLPDAVPLILQRLPELPDGVSSQVLLGLPEVMEAEHMLLMANADIGAARAAFFPSISLTGNLGYMSDDLKRLFVPTSGLWAFLPRVSVPIFNGGRNRAQLELAELRKESSIANYERSIQTAFSMAAEALQSKAVFVNQAAAQENYLAARRQVLALANNSYASGAVSYLEVLDAQREVLLAEQNYLQVRRDQLVNSINLYMALGGGLNAFSNQPQLAAQ
ncbi:MAG: TolC family protein, partial [Planctomycetota bacterium]|jgi:Cu(I)/Ag(I) efflux system outer membrane protein|nr:TolC family protein [Planctomycetota bacterium]